MKRSEINATIKQFEALLDQYRFRIPPYLSFTPEEWADKNHEWDEIRDNMLGWDITDYGEGDFEHKGLALITLRNGNVKDPKSSTCTTLIRRPRSVSTPRCSCAVTAAATTCPPARTSNSAKASP